MECNIQAKRDASKQDIINLQKFYKENASKWLIKDMSRGVKIRSIKEFKLNDDTVIGVFQGSKGEHPELDIILKYIDKNVKGTTPRTPKHIHWVIDLLIKKQYKKELTLEFVKYLRDMWEKIEPFKTKLEQEKCELKQTTSEKIKVFEKLNQHGEYSVEFIGHLIELMMIMEKTGLARAYVFKDLLETILNERDIFTIVSKATQTGK